MSAVPTHFKAISLWEPWASAIAKGLKRVETRDWKTPHRGVLLVHAAKHYTGKERQKLRLLEIVHPAVLEAAIKPQLGYVVAVAELLDCKLMTDEWIGQQTPLERDLGLWEPGRVGWVLGRVVALPRPVAVSGKQLLFNVRPEHVVNAAAWQSIVLAAQALVGETTHPVEI